MDKRRINRFIGCGCGAWRFEGGLRQKQELDAPLQVFAFPIAEARAAIIGFGQLVLLDHRAHGAIEQDDALAEERFERMENVGGHVDGELNRSSRAQQGTN